MSTPRVGSLSSSSSTSQSRCSQRAKTTFLLGCRPESWSTGCSIESLRTRSEAAQALDGRAASSSPPQLASRQALRTAAQVGERRVQADRQRRSSRPLRLAALGHVVEADARRARPAWARWRCAPASWRRRGRFSPASRRSAPKIEAQRARCGREPTRPASPSTSPARRSKLNVAHRGAARRGRARAAPRRPAAGARGRGPRRRRGPPSCARCRPG